MRMFNVFFFHASLQESVGQMDTSSLDLQRGDSCEAVEEAVQLWGSPTGRLQKWSRGWERHAEWWREGLAPKRA
jgi:hypothetical protein